MDKLMIEDGTYKVIYRLPSNSILEFDFSFKKGENYESVLLDNFIQEKIPKVLLSDINLLMSQMLNEERKMKKIYTKNDREMLNSKMFMQNVMNQWLSVKTFKNHIELSTNNKKHITESWQKYTIIKYYNKDDKISEYEKKLMSEYRKYLDVKNTEEMNLRNKQEKEMQEANLKSLQLDLIVNRHINEINQFTKEYEDKLIHFITSHQESYSREIEIAFQDFMESIDTNLMIYNADNKLIQIKIKKSEPNSDIVLSTKSSEPKHGKRSVSNISNALENAIVNGVIFHHRLNFGIFNRVRLYLYFIGVEDPVDNEMKTIFPQCLSTLHQGSFNKTRSEGDEYTINDILKSSEHFGENIYAMVNFFTYDSSESKIVHMTENLENWKVQNELFFESIGKFFKKIEMKCKAGTLPYPFDIFTTKHTNMKNFDLLMSVYLASSEILTEDDCGKALKNLIYFANVFKISVLTLHLERIMEKFFKINKLSDFKTFMKNTKFIISIIRNNYNSLLKSGIKIHLKHVIFSLSNTFMIGFDKSKSIKEFSEKFSNFFMKN